MLLSYLSTLTAAQAVLVIFGFCCGVKEAARLRIALRLNGGGVAVAFGEALLLRQEENL